MSSAVLVERTTFGSVSHGTQAPTSQPGTGSNFCVVPRCTIEATKCKGGFKLNCSCDDDVACGTLQNLCRMLASGTCSCVCTLNGLTLFQCNLTCGVCKCEFTKDGCCVTCTSGDQACCDMLQACCEAIKCCLEKGCCCYVCFSGTPVCCGGNC